MKTGNQYVDAVGAMRFEGIKIDYRWLGHPWLCRTEKNKKPSFWLHAAHVLAEICYFYSPAIDRDPEGHIVTVRKRFHGDIMYQDYSIWSEKLGLTKRQLQDIITFLHQRQLIYRDVRQIVLRNGQLSNNLPHIRPIPQNIYYLTFGDRENWEQHLHHDEEPPDEPPQESAANPSTVPDSDGEEDFDNGPNDFNTSSNESFDSQNAAEGGVPKIREASPEDVSKAGFRDTPPENTGHAPQKNGRRLTQKREASPENTGDSTVRTDSAYNPSCTSRSTPQQTTSNSSKNNASKNETPVVDVVLNSSLSVSNADVEALVCELAKFRIEEPTARQLAQHPDHCRAWIRYAGKSENRNIGPGLIVKRVRDLVFPPDHEEEERKIQAAAARDEQLRREAEERTARVQTERAQLAAEAIELDREYSRLENQERAVVDADAELAISTLMGGRAVTAEQRDSARRGAMRRFLAEREEEERRRGGMSEEELAAYEKKRVADKILSSDAELAKLIPRFDDKVLRRVKKSALSRAAAAGLEISDQHPGWPGLERQAVRELVRQGKLHLEAYL